MGARTIADDLAGTPASRACLDALRGAGSAPGDAMELHCVRVYEVARELARRGSHDVDDELLLCAALLHDIGLYPAASAGGVYTREGADLAEALLAEAGWGPERRRRCASAIACHHALRPVWRLGTEVELIRRADLVDLGAGLVRFGLPRAWLRGLSSRVPRGGLYRGIGGLVLGVLRERPATLPRIFRP